MLGIIVAAYRDFSSRVSLLTTDGLSKPDRVREIMPYLEYDEDPYMVTVDGKLYWIIDAYTYSSKYPYSEPYLEESTVNYVRNSVKVVIDAYNGEVN